MAGGIQGVRVVVAELGGELHGFEIGLVEEVVAHATIHPLPDVPASVLGVTFLRGEPIPVIDISDALGLARLVPAGGALLIVGLGRTRAAIAVDRPGEVREIPAEAVLAAPHGQGERERYLLGVARLDEGLVNLIDLAELLRERATLEQR
jgi:chemotaxis signal transduction protein